MEKSKGHEEGERDEEFRGRLQNRKTCKPTAKARITTEKHIPPSVFHDIVSTRLHAPQLFPQNQRPLLRPHKLCNPLRSLDLSIPIEQMEEGRRPYDIDGTFDMLERMLRVWTCHVGGYKGRLDGGFIEE